MSYDLTKLIDRIKRLRQYPPDWAVDEGLTIKVPPKRMHKASADLIPWDTPVFVELDDGNGSYSAALASVRFERHNDGICIVLSSMSLPGNEAAE